MTTAVLKSSVMRHQEHWEQIATTQLIITISCLTPEIKSLADAFFNAEVLCQSVSFLLVYSLYFCLYTDFWLGLQDCTTNCTVWLFPGDDNIPEIMPETLQTLLIYWKGHGDELPSRITFWWQKCCCVMKQVLWNLFPAYYTWKGENS